MRIAVLTVSDAGVRGERGDTSGDAIAAWAAARGDTVAARAIVGDETAAVAAQLVAWCDGDVADLLLTTGGTGLAPRDITPEATRAILDREAPGIAERIRALCLTSFPRAALARGIAGVRRCTLVVNLPGSTSGVRDALAALDPIIAHGVDILRGLPTEHSGGQGPATVRASSEATGKRPAGAPAPVAEGGP
jgi:molybdenum cofactor synthesis domain-containing protein